MNEVRLHGNVGNPPKIVNFENGNKAAQFSIAVNKRGYTNKEGTVIPDKTTWVNVVTFGTLAETVEKYVTKGQSLLIGGELQNREWTNTDGSKGHITEVLVDVRNRGFIEFTGNRGGNGNTVPPPTDPSTGAAESPLYNTPKTTSQQVPPAGGTVPTSTQRTPAAIADDDLPF
jgi:single-strand DNA-binding protein